MPYHMLLRRGVVALLFCAALVTLCYFFVDRPVAFFVHGQHFSRFEALKWMTYSPIVLEAVAPVVLVLAVVRLAWGPLTRLETTLFCAAVNLMVTLGLKNGLKVAFGRYWPETWTHDNPSLIHDGAYGFHPFHTGPAYESFPSGHTARIFAVLSVVWIAYPKWRWLCVLACGSVVVDQARDQSCRLTTGSFRKCRFPGSSQILPTLCKPSQFFALFCNGLQKAPSPVRILK